MTRNGILINYAFCTGCHSCEIACQVEHDFPLGQWGIKLTEVGPYEIEPDNWQWDYLPVPTKQCDLCADRLAAGKLPTCVHHCQGNIMKYGPIEELAKDLAAKPRQVLFTPQ